MERFDSYIWSKISSFTNPCEIFKLRSVNKNLNALITPILSRRIFYKMKRFLKYWNIDDILQLPFERNKCVISGSFLLYVLCSNYEFQKSIKKMCTENSTAWVPNDIDIMCINDKNIISALFTKLTDLGYSITNSGVLKEVGEYERINKTYLSVIEWKKSTERTAIENIRYDLRYISKFYPHVEKLTFAEYKKTYPAIHVIIVEQTSHNNNIFMTNLLDFDMRILVNQFDGNLLVGYPDDVTTLTTYVRTKGYCANLQGRVYKYHHRGIEILNVEC